MQYMGSKNKISKYIIPLILNDRNNRPYIEPFCGSCSVISKVDGIRIANDSNYYLIEMFKALQKGWQPPKEITVDFYHEVKNNKDKYAPELVSFIGFLCSFGGKFFGGYAKNKRKYNYCLSGFNVLTKLKPLIEDINFINLDYKDINYPNNSIIYCDPPYERTEKYSNFNGFDYEEFLDWCRVMSQKHTVYISEYNMPLDFKEIFSFEINCIMNKNKPVKKIEKLFTYRNHRYK